MTKFERGLLLTAGAMGALSLLGQVALLIYKWFF
jgi:hypothetical protein